MGVARNSQRLVLGAIVAATLSGFFNVAVVAQDAQDTKAPPPQAIERLLEHPYGGYELIIQIDKAKEGTALHAQRLRIHHFNAESGSIAFVARWHASTGAEAAKENMLGRISPRTTIPGFYAVQRLEDTAYSNSWDGLMLFSLYYDYPRYAIHATEPYKYFKLGRRASGGCTRLEHDSARLLFNVTQSLGKGWTLKLDRRTGKPVLDAQGNPVVHWSYKALVLVEDGGRLEATRFGFIDREIVFETKDSMKYYLGEDYDEIPTGSLGLL